MSTQDGFFICRSTIVLYTDINEMKSILEIDVDNHVEDKNLNFFNEWASAWFEEWINRPIVRRERTEYYNGTGTQKILLKSRPVFSTPTPACVIDESGAYGTSSGSFTGTPLVWGSDFTLFFDNQEDGSCRNGILLRLGTVWPNNYVRSAGLLSPYTQPGVGNVRITYTAGYTVDTLPAQLRASMNFLIAKMRYLFPLGLDLSSDSYEERSISWSNQNKTMLLSLVQPFWYPYRNWRW